MFDMPSKIKIKADIQSLKYYLNLTGLRAGHSESFFKSADTSSFLQFVDNSTLYVTQLSPNVKVGCLRTSRSFHYQRLVPRRRPFPWLANPGTQP